MKSVEDMTPEEQADYFENSHHAVPPSRTDSVPKEYDPPDDGKVTVLELHTPTGEVVGTLRYNDGGIEWRTAEDAEGDTVAYSTEVMLYLRGHAQQEISIDSAVEGIRSAFAGALTESEAEYTSAELAAFVAHFAVEVR
jgi:hypothetical protein